MAEIKLFDHNQKAYEAVVSMLEATGRAAVIHPTGTGKSFIAFRYCADHPNSRICWLSPSEYIFKTQVENLKEASGVSLENIQFFTYARLMNMTRREMKDICPDCIILDEFHRCGAELWGKGVQRLLDLYRDTKVLGLSATNIRYLDNRRDMADELFQGNVASHMTLGEAIVQGILNPPKYVLSLYSCQKELEYYEKLVTRSRRRLAQETGMAYLEALRRAVSHMDGLEEIFHKHMEERTGKYIVFCANKAHMDEMIALAPQWFAKVDAQPRIYSLYSEDPGADKAFQAFKDDEDDSHLRLLYTINALNEGIHVQGISGVILLRPTVSPIIFKQQIGRAISASKGHRAVIFDVVMNIENLNSIDTIGREIQDAIQYCSAEEKTGEIVNEYFQVVDEVRSCRELFQKLEETLSASWERMYEKAEEYFKDNGDLDVPARYVTEDGYTLGTWLVTQRKVRAGLIPGNLDQERIRDLDAIGMRWESASELQWERNFAAAKSYFETHGDLDVKVHYVTEDGFALGQWISNVRAGRKDGQRFRYLTEERIQDLDAIGMIWDQQDRAWNKKYAAAKAYYDAHGDLKVPLKYVTEDGFRLGSWIQQIRASRNRGQALSEERIAQLDAIGMSWDSRSAKVWEKGFAELQSYARRTGSCNVPFSFITDTGYRLGVWVEDQRQKRAAGKLKTAYIERLDQIGFLWQKDDPWEMRYRVAKAYYEEHKNLKVPAKLVVDGVWLNKWLNEQKQVYLGKRKGKQLTEGQIMKLDALGIQWPDIRA